MSNRKTSDAVKVLYQKARPSLPVAEDADLAYHKYGGNKYEMIVVAAARARMIANGDPVLIKDKTHKPTVAAVLEIQEGHLNAQILTDLLKNGPY